MKWIRGFHFLVILLFLGSHDFQPISAAPVVFTVNSAQSQVTIAGTVVGGALSAQGAGSLTTSYSGSINANLTGSTIQFTGGSSINAKTNGVWQPAVGGGSGSAAADYGAKATITVNVGIPISVTANAALRNVVFDLTSPVLVTTDGSFDGSSLVFAFFTNTASFDYNYSYGSGSENLNGYSTNTLVSGATVSTNAGVRTLSIQINSQFVFKVLTANDSTIDLTGQLVATNAIATAAPFLNSITINSQNVVVVTENTSAQSLLQVSTDLLTWSAAPATVTTNGSGMIVFTSPFSGGLHAFYRVQQ
jgi:hypothetical protein